MRHIRLLHAVVLSAACFSCSVPEPSARLVAPNPNARPIDQLSLSVNACGPAALLNAFSAGSEPWQKVAEAVPGKSDRDRLAYIIKRYALHPSKHFRDQRRWSRRGGIGAIDLADMATEMAAAGGKLSGIRSESFVDTRNAPAALLRRLHRRLATSLKRGLPPILVLKRMARPKSGATTAWTMVEGHYVVVTSLPARLLRSTTAFDIDCIDPNGGQHRHATIHTSSDPSIPWLLIDCPGTPVGQRRLRSGQISHLSASAVIGRF